MGNGDRYGILNGRILTGLVRFGVPLSFGMGLHAMFNVVDMAVVGNLPDGARALGVIALCDLLAMVGTIVGTGIGNAAAAVIARKVGEGNQKRAGEACWGSLGLLVAAGVVLAAFALLFSGPIVSVMGAKGWLYVQAVDYLKVILGGSVTIFALLHVTSALRAAGHSATPTLLVFGANLLNLVLSVLLVYGPTDAPRMFSWGPPLAELLGLPHMGVLGAAWGTVIARGLVAIPGFLLLLRDFPRPRIADFLPRGMEARQLLTIGWPSTAQYGVRVGAILVLLGVIAHRFTSETDVSVLSAMGVCVRLDTIGLFMALGWGSAAATFVGQNLGAGNYDRARKAGWLAAGICGVLLAFLGAAYVALAGVIVPLFTPDESVLEWCRLYLWVVAPVYAFVGVAAALSTALSGAGETMASLRIDSLVLLGFQTPVLLLLAGVFEASLLTCFVLVAVAHVSTAVLYVYAFSRGKWRRRKVV